MATDEERREYQRNYMREWNKANPGKSAATSARRYDRHGARYQATKRAKLDALKAKPCMDCGVQYPPYIMEFDHRNPDEKLFAIGTSVMTYAKERLDAELAKCDLVCSNCHRERTHQQRLSGLRFGGAPRKESTRS